MRDRTRNAERELHEPRHEIDGHAAAALGQPVSDVVGGDPGHGIGHGGKLLHVECRLGQPSVLAPRLALGREHPVAEELLQHRDVLDEAVIAVVFHEHVLDRVGMKDEEVRRGSELHAHDFSIIAEKPADEIERVLREFGDAPHEKMARRPRRGGWFGRRPHGGELVPPRAQVERRRDTLQRRVFLGADRIAQAEHASRHGRDVVAGFEHRVQRVRGKSPTQTSAVGEQIGKRGSALLEKLARRALR
jgi:hypothetical protein